MGEVRRQFKACLAECHFLAVNVVRENLEDFLFTESLNREATRALGKRCNPQDRCVFIADRNDIMAHASVVIGAVTPAHLDGFVEFGEQLHDTSQDVQKFFTIMAYPAIKFMHRSRTHTGTIG